MRDIAIGTGATGTRMERDSMGPIEVPAEHYWGAQTQRSLVHFSIGNDIMPIGIPHAYGYVKKAAAMVNEAAGRLDPARAAAICAAADEVIAGKLDGEFPLYVWQTGSGTQSNMNANEVMANRATQWLGLEIGAPGRIHPNDDLNLGQSSNDTFPTAMHVAAVLELEERLLPSLRALYAVLADKSAAWADVIKIGRTHLQDAVPLTVGQEWSGYAAQLGFAIAGVEHARGALYELAAGGTAVGHGAQRTAGFRRGDRGADRGVDRAPVRDGAQQVRRARRAGRDGGGDGGPAWRRGGADENRQRSALVGERAPLRVGELILPENEPGSSIMPGKVNPTQCEAMVMICTQVIGEDAAVAFAGSQGQFELNTMRPIVINNFLHSARILGDGAGTFRRYTVEGTELNRPRIAELLDRSLMLVTALSPVIGYDRAAAIAHDAHVHGLTLREAALASGAIDAATFDATVDARTMV